MIHVADLQTRLRIPAAKVRALASRILGKRNLSVAFVTAAAIRKLNRKFLRHDYATDVLAFRLDSDLLGEVVISADAARAEAKRRGIPVEEELLRYVVHGILHLLGYDDHAPADRARMWKRQERLLGAFLKRRVGKGSR
jgi:probable rRNA maturation factor